MTFPEKNIHFIRYDDGTPANAKQPPEDKNSPGYPVGFLLFDDEEATR